MKERLLRQLTAAERDKLIQGGFGGEVGGGAKPALILVDVQNYMIDPPPGSQAEYPVACGEVAKKSLVAIEALLHLARGEGHSIVFTQNVYRRDGSGMGAYGLKRGLLKTEGWCYEGSEGAEVHRAVTPRPGELVVTKSRPSAFFETGLDDYLAARDVDSIVLAGGSTSNCIRATAVDGCSYGYRVLVVEEAVFDRFEASHDIALFDLQRQHADVVRLEEAVAYFRRLGKSDDG